MLSQLSLTVLVLPLLASGSSAQSPRQHAKRADVAGDLALQTAAERPAVSAPGFHESAGGRVAFGSDYVLRLDAGGARFHPLHGDRALGLELESIALGDASWLAAGAPVLSSDGSRAVLRHGALVEERYELRPEGVELSFLLRALPGEPGEAAGVGDLAVRIAVHGGLSAPPGEHGAEGIVFGDGTTTHVRVGGVTAIDARGMRCDGRIAWDGAALELRVPAAFVADAALPLLIDPLIETEMLISVPASQPDVAYDATTGVYLVVFEGQANNIAGRRFDASGMPLGFTFEIETTGFPAYPQVANVNASDRFLVVYLSLPFGGPRQAVARAVDAGSGAVSPELVVGTGLGSSFIYPTYPVVGGDPVPPFDDALVAWIDLNSSVRARLVECPPSGPPTLVGAELTLTDTNSDFALQVTRSNGPSGHWLLVWQRYHSSPPAHYDVVGTTVDYTGQVCSPETVLLGTVGESEYLPSCAGDGVNFAVVAQQSTAAGPLRVVAACVTRTDACTLVPGAAQELSHGTEIAPDPDVAIVSVAVVDDGFLASWLTKAREIVAVRLSPNDCNACGPTTVVSDLADWPDASPSAVRSASRHSSSFTVDGEDQVFVTWENKTGPTEVRGALVDAFGGGGSSGFLPGCGGVATLTTVGDPFPGHLDFGLKLFDVEAHLGPSMLMLTPSPQVFPFENCMVITPSIVIPMQISAPEFFLPVPLDCQASFAGVVWRLQWVITGLSESPIPSLPGVGLSNAIEITFGG